MLTVVIKYELELTSVGVGSSCSKEPEPNCIVSII